MRSRSLKVGEERKISHESTVRVASWGMRNHLDCTIKSKIKQIITEVGMTY